MNFDKKEELKSMNQMKRKLRVAVFSKIPIAPDNGGNRVHIRSTCQTLMALDCEVNFFLIPSRQLKSFDKNAHTKFFGAENFEILERSFFRYILDQCKLVWNILVIRKFHIFLSRAFKLSRRRKDVDYTYPSGLDPIIKDIATQNHFDLILVQYVHFSRILTHFDASVYKVLQTHDSFHNELQTAAETKGFLRADSILAIQETEAERFKAYLNFDSERVKIFSHVVNLGELVLIEGCGGATFIGSNMEANRTSIDFFILRILPLILRVAPNFKLFVAGSICNHIEDQDGIVKEGYVSNLKTIFDKAPILVNPIMEGTGIKIKLLDAMSFGVPIVSTELGVQGVTQDYLQGIKIAPDDRPDIFAQHVLELFNDQQMMIILGHKNRISAERWNERQIDRLKDVIDEGKNFMHYRD